MNMMSDPRVKEFEADKDAGKEEVSVRLPGAFLSC